MAMIPTRLDGLLLVSRFKSRRFMPSTSDNPSWMPSATLTGHGNPPAGSHLLGSKECHLMR